MPGRLNIFQKTMLQWNTMHPYVAIHVMRLRGAFDAARLQSCVKRTIEKRGISQVTLNPEHSTFHYSNGPAKCEIQILGGQSGSLEELVAEMERQLNLPFVHAEPFNPFRFVVLPSGDSFFLGVVYFHSLADAESVVLLLKGIAHSLLGEGTAVLSDSLELYPDPRSHLLSRHPLVVTRRLLGLPRQIGNLRQSHRARYHDANNLANGFVLFSVPSEDWRPAVAAAKAWDVTVNDLLMGVLMKALSPCAGERVNARRRRKISIGCIVSLRKEMGAESGRTMGLFLGSFVVTHEVPDGIPLRQLARDIWQQTSAIKRQKSYLGTPLDLRFANFMFNLFSPQRQKKFYSKHYPLMGGITNMNLNSLWEQGNGAPLDYFRGVSTGPVTPLALSVTTFGDRANLGLSYRTTVFSKLDIEKLRGRFMEHLQETRRAA
jgi:hypothetical protein